jgi:hypothetical protein
VTRLSDTTALTMIVLATSERNSGQLRSLFAGVPAAGALVAPVVRASGVSVIDRFG